MIDKYSKVAVIGAGTMGNGIAHVFAQSGYDVNLIDISEAALEKALAKIAKNMDRQIKKEKITHFEYQLPDEYRLDRQLTKIASRLSGPWRVR